MVLHYSKTLTNEVKKGYIWIARRYHMLGSKQIITAELNDLEQRQKINDFFSAPASSNCNFGKKEKIDLGKKQKYYQKASHTSKTNHPIPTHISISKKSSKNWREIYGRWQKEQNMCPLCSINPILSCQIKYQVWKQPVICQTLECLVRCQKIENSSQNSRKKIITRLDKYACVLLHR